MSSKSDGEFPFSNLSPIIHVRFSDVYLEGPFDKIGYIADNKDQIRVLLGEIGAKKIGCVNIHYMADDGEEREAKRKHGEFHVIDYDEIDTSVRYNLKL